MNRREYEVSGEIIRELPSKLGLTKEEFSARVGVTWSVANQWGKGRGKPRLLATRQTDATRELRTHAVPPNCFSGEGVHDETFIAPDRTRAPDHGRFCVTERLQR